jgi:hypothetical protein
MSIFDKAAGALTGRTEVQVRNDRRMAEARKRAASVRTPTYGGYGVNRGVKRGPDAGEIAKRVGLVAAGTALLGALGYGGYEAYQHLVIPMNNGGRGHELAVDPAKTNYDPDYGVGGRVPVKTVEVTAAPSPTPEKPIQSQSETVTSRFSGNEDVALSVYGGAPIELKADGVDIKFTDEQKAQMEAKRQEAMKAGEPVVVFTTQKPDAESTPVEAPAETKKPMSPEKLKENGITVVNIGGSRELVIYPDVFGKGGLLEEWAERDKGSSMTLVVVPGSKINPEDIPAGVLPDTIRGLLRNMPVTAGDIKSKALEAYQEQVDYARETLNEAKTGKNAWEVAGASEYLLHAQHEQEEVEQTPAIFWKNGEGNDQRNKGANYVTLGNSGGEVFVVVPGGVDPDMLRVPGQSEVAVYVDPLGNYGVTQFDPVNNFALAYDQPAVGISTKEAQDAGKNGYSVCGALANLLIQAQEWAKRDAGGGEAAIQASWEQWMQAVASGEQPLGFDFK